MYRIDDATATASVPTPEAALAEGFFTEGNAAAGTPATNVRGSWLNMVQEELRNIVTAAGLTPSKTTYTQVLQAIRAMTADTSRVQGLRGNNSATTPNSQMVFSADSVTLRNASTGATAVVVGGTGSITNDLTVAGPVVNGRDQAAAFPVSSWIHYYFVWNGTTVATVSSLATPTTGPALPSGYTSWAYIGVVRYSSGSALLGIHMVGAWALYATQTALVSNGAATTATPVSAIAYVPPNALEMELNITQVGCTSTSTGAYSVTALIQIETGLTAFQAGLQGQGASSTVLTAISGTSKRVANLTQGFNYYLVLNAGTSPNLTLNVSGYKMPNGGE